MKKLLTMVVALLCATLTLNAQVDITTGQGTIGTSDPIWEVLEPGAVSYVPVTISTGVLQSGGTLYPSAYVQNSCGQWISPLVNADYNIISGPAAGIYTYRMKFDGDCADPTALMDIGFIAADNEVTDIRVNGTSYMSDLVPTSPGVVTHLNPGTLNSTVGIVPGANFLEIDVDNYGSYTALHLCGEIALTYTSYPAPTNLDCCEALSGTILSWDAVAGAIGYEIEIIWNDPDCCPAGGEVFESYFNTTATVFLLPVNYGCYSWKVKAIFDECESEFSEKLCGCETCPTPEELDCAPYNNGRILTWMSVASALGYEIEITWNDPACCTDGGEVYVETFYSGTNSFFVDDIGLCFSWRVRSICDDEVFSAWSESKCACTEEGARISPGTGVPTEDLKVSVSPNPANSFVEFNVEFPGHEDEAGELTILDMNSRVVHTSSISMSGKSQVKLGDLPSGVYVYSIVTENVINTGKIVVNK